MTETRKRVSEYQKEGPVKSVVFRFIDRHETLARCAYVGAGGPWIALLIGWNPRSHCVARFL